jgi:choline-sulfatase
MFRRTLGLLALGLAVFLAWGVGRWILLCAANRYFQQGLRNLALLELMRILNRYALVFAGCAVGILAVTVLGRVARRFLRIEAGDPTRLHALGDSVSLLIFLTGLGGLFSYEASFVTALITPPPLSQLPRELLNLFFRLGLPKGYLFFTALYGGFAAVTVCAGTFLLARLRLIRSLHEPSRTWAESIWLRGAGAALLLCLAGLNAWPWLGARRASSDRPNVVLISVDTLRADHLETYGYARETAPNIARLAERGVVFRNAYAPAPWTLPSMASVHTGLYSYQHAAMHWDARVSDELATLAETLKNNFYATIGVLSIPWLSAAHGFAQGFDVFDQSEPGGDPDAVSSPALTQKAMRYLKLYGKKKFFLWIHYLDPHYSYVRHPEYGYADQYDGLLPAVLEHEHLNRVKGRLSTADLRYILDVYDEEISFTDAAIGRILQALRELGLADHTIVVLTADHGEEFLERDKIGHGKTLYQELIHVPLVIAGAIPTAFRGLDSNKAVETRSLGRTILNLCGARRAVFPGVDLLEQPKGDEPQTQGLVFSEGSYAEGEDGRRQAVISLPWKLIRSLDDGSYELYDLRDDRQEKRNLFAGGNAEQREAGALLARELQAFGSGVRSRVRPAAPTEEEIRKLRSLGYLK